MKIAGAKILSAALCWPAQSFSTLSVVRRKFPTPVILPSEYSPRDFSILTLSL